MMTIWVKIHKPDLTIERDGEFLVISRPGVVYKRKKLRKEISVYATKLSKASKWRKIWAVLRGRIFGFVIRSHDVVTMHRVKTGIPVEEFRIEVPETMGEEWDWVTKYDRSTHRTTITVFTPSERNLLVDTVKRVKLTKKSPA